MDVVLAFASGFCFFCFVFFGLGLILVGLLELAFARLFVQGSWS